MTRAQKTTSKKKNEPLNEVAEALGLGSTSKNKQSRVKQLSARTRGKPIDAHTRRLVAMRLLLQRAGDTYRVISQQLGVSTGSITNIKKKLVAARLSIVHGRNGGAPPIELIDKALVDRPRVGGRSIEKEDWQQSRACSVSD